MKLSSYSVGISDLIANSETNKQIANAILEKKKAVAELINESGAVPVRCHRGYDLPNWWTPDWLIIATSYSGNTEETLEACQQAMNQGATIVVISSGGELAGRCELSQTMYLISCPSGQPPR